MHTSHFDLPQPRWRWRQQVPATRVSPTFSFVFVLRLNRQLQVTQQLSELLLVASSCADGVNVANGSVVVPVKVKWKWFRFYYYYIYLFVCCWFCQANIFSCFIVVLVIWGASYAHFTHCARAKFKVTARSCWAKTTTTTITKNQETKAYQRWSRIFNGFFVFSVFVALTVVLYAKYLRFTLTLVCWEGNLEIMWKFCAY